MLSLSCQQLTKRSLLKWSCLFCIDSQNTNSDRLPEYIDYFKFPKLQKLFVARNVRCIAQHATSSPASLAVNPCYIQFKKKIKVNL